MRKRLGLAAVAALVVALASVTLASASSPKTKASDAHAVQVIRLTTVPIQSTNLDLGAEGFSQGDQEVFTDNVFRDGKKVGRSTGFSEVTYVAGNTFTAQLVATLTLPRGSITGQGAFTQDSSVGPKPFFVAITGGTGAYRTAHGQARVEITETGASVTLHLIL